MKQYKTFKNYGVEKRYGEVSSRISVFQSFVVTANRSQI